MRKSLLLSALFLLFSFMGFAQEWHGISSETPSPMKKTLISSTENETIIEVNLAGFYTQNVTTPEGKQVVVSVKDMAYELEAGAPQLSYDVIPVMIGDMAEMKVTVVNSTYVDYENVEVAPSKGNFSRQINPEDVPYTYGEMYQQDAFWPAAQVSLDAPYIIRDFRGQNIVVRPFAYNPVTKTLRVYTNMTIAMTKVSDNGENPKLARKSNTVKTSPEFKASYERRFINFAEAAGKYPFIEDNGEMLIICADQFMTSMEPLVEWKNQSGRPTTMVSVTTAGGNSDTGIKSYISNMYNDPNHNLVYVLFVGDYEHITPHSLGSERSDNWFGQVEGTDHYPEVFIGRFSVQTNAHVTSQVNKVLYYERDLQPNVTWCDKGMGIGYYGAGSGHFGEDDYRHIDLIRDTLLHYTYSVVTEHHGGSGGDASTSTISATTNQGISIINYCNHGSETSWGVANYSTSNVNALTNDNMWPIVWSVACLNGKFDYGGAGGECFAEAWMRATNNSNGTPTGAIGGMFSWMSQPWIPPMYGQDEMVNVLCEWRNVDQFNHTLAGASLNGNMDVIDKSNDTECHDTWVLFGDPSLMVRTANPTDMSVTATPSVLMLGMTELEVYADADYAIATLSMDGEVLASQRLINGHCTMTFPALSNVGGATLVVMGFNRATYVGEIDVLPAEGAYVTVNGYEMSAPQANYGETIDLSIDFKNVGVDIANNVVATISTENEYINITAAEVAFDAINPDEVLTIEGFQFEVSANVPDGTKAQLDVNVTDGTDVWVGKIIIDLHAPVLAFNNMVTTDTDVALTFLNSGSAPLYGGEFTLISCSPDLVFDPETIAFDDVIEGGETITLNAGYTVAESVEPGTTFEVAYEMTSGLFVVQNIFVLSYGAIMEDFESGTFGSDWTFSTPNAWTIVDGGVKGTKCAKSANAGMANSDYNITLTVNVLAAGELTFMYYVSSETNYDKLHFYMDNQEKGTWSGEVSWTQFTQAVTAGQHTFKWSYTKDGSVNNGGDCAMIDDILFPPTSVITFIDPATGLEATVEGHDVMLTWEGSADAESYLVKRNDATLATVTETEYVDALEESGTYKYSVYAVNANGSMSAPVTVFVQVDFDGVEEISEMSVSVYPNPANGVMNIVTNVNNYEYQIVNSIGQVVMSGNANGKTAVDVSELNGVYFLKVVANGNTEIQKVVIK